MTRSKLKTPRTAESQTRLFGLKMLTPTMLVLLVMTAYPLIFTFIYSFTNYNYLKGAKKASFVMFANYIKLFKNDYFRQAVLNTIKFTICAVILEMLLGLMIAVFINSLKKAQKIMRTLLLLPYLLPAVTVALSWRMMLSSNYGIINQFLSGLGLPYFNWFLDTRTAFWTILVIDVWQNVPFVFLLLFASLQSVPEGQYEAAPYRRRRRIPAVLVRHHPEHQKQPCAVCSASYHRHVPPLRKGQRPDRRRPGRYDLHHHAVSLQLRHQVA